MKKIGLLFVMFGLIITINSCKKDKKDYGQYTREAAIDEESSDSLGNDSNYLDGSSSDSMSSGDDKQYVEIDNSTSGASNASTESSTDGSGINNNYPAYKSKEGNSSSSSTNSGVSSNSTRSTKSNSSKVYRPKKNYNNGNRSVASNDGSYSGINPGYVKQNTINSSSSGYYSPNKNNNSSTYNSNSSTYNSNNSTYNANSGRYNASNNSSTTSRTQKTKVVTSSNLKTIDNVGSNLATVVIENGKMTYTNQGRAYKITSDLNKEKEFLSALEDIVYDTHTTTFPFNFDTSFIYDGKTGMFTEAKIPFNIQVDQKKYTYLGNHVRELFLYQPDLTTADGKVVKFEPIRITASKALKILRYLNYNISKPIVLDPKDKSDYVQIPADYLARTKQGKNLR